MILGKTDQRGSSWTSGGTVLGGPQVSSWVYIYIIYLEQKAGLHAETWRNKYFDQSLRVLLHIMQHLFEFSMRSQKMIMFLCKQWF